LAVVVFGCLDGMSLASELSRGAGLAKEESSYACAQQNTVCRSDPFAKVFSEKTAVALKRASSSEQKREPG
jgi:hypothetical protein